ncbi:hypothetical protein [Rhizobium sp. YTU87027]|uniref:hypothetical protein n=1 Tax=Rhizobium sp. YTU87027 TaxID=3417741 RepID=UPI003D6913E4
MAASRTCAVILLEAGLFVLQGLPLADDDIKSPAQKAIAKARTEVEPSMIAMNVRGANLQGEASAPGGILANAITFAGQPVRRDVVQTGPSPRGRGT